MGLVLGHQYVKQFHDDVSNAVIGNVGSLVSFRVGAADQHDYQLYIALNDIEHTKTKVKSPQTNGICEHFHKTILNEFYQVTLRKKIYQTIDELQADFDEWLIKYNTQRTHQGKMCCGRTPMETLIDGKQIWMEKFVN